MNKPMPGSFPSPLLQKLHEELAALSRHHLAALCGAVPPLMTLAAVLSDLDGRLRTLEQGRR